MWYRDKYFLNKNNEYENILIEFNNFINQNKRFSDKNIPKGLILNGLLLSGKAISFLLGQLLKIYPDLKPMVDGLNRFLFGNGEEYKLPIELFSQEIRVGFLKRALTIKDQYGEDWDKNNKVDFLWSYNDYKSSYFNYSSDDNISKGYRDPLRYIIGGFTPQIWWNKEKNGDINVYAKIIDKYDWKERSFSYIRIKLPDDKKIRSMIENIINLINKTNIKNDDIPRIENSFLIIPDSFFNSLQSAGICKPYINSFEGKILTLNGKDFPEIEDPLERLEILSNLSYPEAIKNESYNILKYLLNNNYEIKCVQYIDMILDLFLKYLTVDDINKIMKLSNIEDLSRHYFYINTIEKIKNIESINYLINLGCNAFTSDLYNEDIFLDKSIFNEFKLILKKLSKTKELKSYIINNYHDDLIISNIDYLIKLLDLSVDDIYYMANELYSKFQDESKVINFLSIASKSLPIDPNKIMNDIKGENSDVVQ